VRQILNAAKVIVIKEYCELCVQSRKGRMAKELLFSYQFYA